MTYSDKLKDPRWQKKRLKILERDEWTCKSCGSTKDTLHVHHQYYIKGNEPWHYPDHLLLTLCHLCHEEEEGMKTHDSEFMDIMLGFGLTRLEISTFVFRLWDHLNNKKDRRLAFKDLCESIEPTEIENG